MRDILFRGKVKFNGTHLFSGDWVMGSLITKTKGVFIYVIEKDELDNVLREFEVEVDPETVGQYTGVVMEEGGLLFEGDLVACFFEEEVINQKLVQKNHYSIYPIKFHRGGFSTGEEDEILLGCWISDPDTRAEIIGNIYDTPEYIQLT